MATMALRGLPFMADCFCPQEIIIGNLQNVLYHNVGTKVEVEVDQWPAFTSVIVRMHVPVLVVSKYQQILLVFSGYLCPPIFLPKLLFAVRYIDKILHVFIICSALIAVKV